MLKTHEHYNNRHTENILQYTNIERHYNKYIEKWLKLVKKSCENSWDVNFDVDDAGYIIV